MYKILLANSAPEKGVGRGQSGGKKAVSGGVVNEHKIVMERDKKV